MTVSLSPPLAGAVLSRVSILTVHSNCRGVWRALIYACVDPGVQAGVKLVSFNKSLTAGNHSCVLVDKKREWQQWQDMVDKLEQLCDQADEDIDSIDDQFQKAKASFAEVRLPRIVRRRHRCADGRILRFSANKRPPLPPTTTRTWLSPHCARRSARLRKTTCME